MAKRNATIPSIDIFVEGTPYAKQSFRFKHNGKNYISAGVRAWQDTISAITLSEYRGKVLEIPLGVQLDFFYRWDADVDNFSKCVLDALQGIVFKNDRQIVALMITKRKGTEKIGVRIRIHDWRSFNVRY